MTVTVRWVFADSTESWTVPINPDQMDSPHTTRDVQAANGGVKVTAIRRPRLFERPSPAKEFSFGGVIRTKEHYDELLRWTKKNGPIQISDHLGRTFEVLITSFAPTDRRVTQGVPWRARYTMTCLLLRRVT